MKDIMTDMRDDFWDAMEDVSDAMLGLHDGPLIPMTPKVRDDADDGKIWFVTAQGTDLQQAVETSNRGARLVVADRSAGIWADITGTLEQVTDAAVLDDIWTVMTGVWFEDGKQDSDVRLLCFTPLQAEATISDNNAVETLYKLAKAKIKGETPEGIGWQSKITF